jgi:hypothetical protein
VQDGSSRHEVVTCEVERQEVGEGLAPYARAHTVYPEGRVRERVECRIDAVHLVRARVDGKRERDAEDLWEEQWRRGEHLHASRRSIGGSRDAKDLEPSALLVERAQRRLAVVAAE